MSGEGLEIKFERFAAKALQQHAQTLDVLAMHGRELKDVKTNLAAHLNDHLQDLQRTLDDARMRSRKNTELWLGTLVGGVGVIVALLALLKK